MKNKLFQRALCMILTLALLLSAVCLTSSAASLKVDPTGTEKHPYQPSTLEEMKSLVGTLTYEEYMATHEPNGDKVLSSIEIPIADFDGNGVIVSEDDKYCGPSMIENPDAWANFNDPADVDKYGKETADTSVYLPASGSVTWRFTLSEEQAGMYFIKIVYYNCITSESSISPIEKLLKIDGKVPFDEIATVNFSKNWTYNNITVETFEVPGAEDSYNTEYIPGENDYKKVVTHVSNGVKTVTTYTITQDINGNSMSPSSAPIPMWNTYYLQDSTGYYNGYFNFYMADGTRSFTLEAEREPVIIKSIELVPVTEQTKTPTYSEILAEYEAMGLKPAVNGSIIDIQAEFPDLVSDSSVNAANDNTSALNFPIDSGAQLFNIIGENGFSSVGQWTAYKFRVTESGLYNLAMRYKQNALEGMFICRSIKLAGGHYGTTPTVPFEEANNARFGYNKDWQSTFVSDGESDPFAFYFEEGVEYTLYLECSLGSLKEHIQKVETTLSNVNAAYLSILQLTGTDPDEYRDYNFLKTMPQVLVTLLTAAGDLMEVKESLEALCGSNGSHLANLETVARLFQKMGSDGGANVAANMASLKSYLGTLGTWINDSKSGTMLLDSVRIVPMTEVDGKAVPRNDGLLKANANFFQSFWLEVTSFFNSFFVDYDQMGLTKEPDENTSTVDVWLASGRDQSQIWRTMIDAKNGFTDSTGNAVALKLVAGGTLLPSILSGKGPDVYLGLGASDVINYAIRDAVMGMSGNDTKGLTPEENSVFTTVYYTYKDSEGKTESPTTEYRGEENLSFVSDTYKNVTDANFADAAMDTLTLLDVSYGVPITMSFSMMFYRMDVLAELDLEVPESWGELLSILPILQSNNMSIGVGHIAALDYMIYQEGGSMWKYTDETLYESKWAGAKVDLDSDIALEAFDFTCRLYSDYSFPVSYDAANRFRTGEMPIVIGDYGGTYNQLVVYATEIDGLWEFCSLPGSHREDGSFNYDALATVSASVILHGCDNMLAAWQFIQWQTSAEVQAEYGNRMVALLGPSAKYETANLNAIDSLSWTAKEKAAIMNQMEHMSSIVNYPGSYIIGRYVQFAFYDAVNNGAKAIDALTGYIDAINSEITRKRQEFGLETLEADEEPPQKESAN